MGEHFQFVYARLPTELAENRQECPRIPPSKNGVGLFLISLSFQSYGLFCRKKRPHLKHQTLRGCRKKKQATSGKSPTPFLRVMCEKTFTMLTAPLR